jgi:transposase
MARRFKITSWLDGTEFAAWMQDAQTKQEYQHRLCIWLASKRSFSGSQIADMLGVSVPAVWRWVGQYNHSGPQGLARRGRGGRRWGFLTLTEERQLLADLLEQASQGQVLTAKQLLPAINARLKREVSLDYVYRLLHRHEWRKIQPRPRHVKADPLAVDAFKKASVKRSRRR